MSDPVLEPLGDGALLLRLGEVVDETLNARVHVLAGAIRAQPWPEVSDVVPTYASVTVHLDPMPPAQWAEREAALLHLAREAVAGEVGEPRIVEIPVRYGGEDGPDVAEVAAHAGLSPEEVIRRHAGGLYRVYFMGFSPGFPYMGGLDPALATPRRETPRKRVPAGSVGIGGSQTGIYPQASPGGWQLLGRTEVALFDPQADPPCLLSPGDLVRFREVR